MPRYKYSCTQCDLKDVKQFIYKSGGGIGRNQEPTCKICGGILKLDFLNPPREWLNQQRRI